MEEGAPYVVVTVKCSNSVQNSENMTREAL